MCSINLFLFNTTSNVCVVFLAPDETGIHGPANIYRDSIHHLLESCSVLQWCSSDPKDLEIAAPQLQSMLLALVAFGAVQRLIFVCHGGEHAVRCVDMLRVLDFPKIMVVIGIVFLAPQIYQLNIAELRAKHPFVEYLFIHGRRDGVKDANNSQRLEELCRVQRIPCRLHLYDKGTHDFRPQKQQALHDLLEWVEFRIAQQPTPSFIKIIKDGEQVITKYRELRVHRHAEELAARFAIS
jgi:hypothetical protein